MALHLTSGSPLVVFCRSWRTVRPLGDRNQKNGMSFRSVGKCHNHRGPRQACAPTCRLRQWNEENQMWTPVPVTDAQVSWLGEHVAHRAGFQRRQFLLVDGGFGCVEYLRLGSAS